MASGKTLTPRKTAVQERSKFTVEAIYEAAVQVFTEYGYAGSTTDLIAGRAGVSVGTLYQYFPNKQAILIGIWNRNMEDADRGREYFVNWFKKDKDLDPDKIKSVVKAVFRLHKESIKPQLFFEEIPQPDFIKERLLEKESAAIKLYAAMLESGRNLRTRRTDIAARMVYEIIERLIHRYLAHFHHEMSEDEFLAETSDIISRYLFADDQ
jgi:AcrR family transcriptional regulator